MSGIESKKDVQDLFTRIQEDISRGADPGTIARDIEKIFNFQLGTLWEREAGGGHTGGYNGNYYDLGLVYSQDCADALSAKHGLKIGARTSVKNMDFLELRDCFIKAAASQTASTSGGYPTTGSTATATAALAPAGLSMVSWLEARGLEVLLPSLNAEDIHNPEDLAGCGEKDIDIFLSSVTLSLGQKAVFRKAVAAMGSKAAMDAEKASMGSKKTAEIAEIRRSIAAMTGVPTYAGSNISEAASKGAWHDIVRLIEAGADLKQVADDYKAPVLASLAGDQTRWPEQQDPLPTHLLMRWLLMQGADPNQGDLGGKVPLHLWGKYGGSLEQGRVLLEFGADVNHEMEVGYTPLWYVRYYKYPKDRWEQAAEMLVEAGAVQKPPPREPARVGFSRDDNGAWVEDVWD